MLRRRVMVPGYRCATTAARALPSPAASALAAGLGRVLRHAMPARRAMVARHQQRIAGGRLSPEELERQVAKTFDSYARYWVGAFRLNGRSTAAIDAGIRVDGAGHIDEALALGNGVIMAMPHVGAWDHGGAWVGHHWPITVVAERIEPPELFAWFCRERAKNRMRVVALGPDAGPVLLRALRANEVVGLLCDRDVAGGGIEVELFGERTTLPAGPATLSLRTGAPILPNAVYRLDDGSGQVHGVIRPPIPFERSGKLRADVTALTQLLARELEALISARPEQWHVLQPNWPSDPGYRGQGGAT